MIDASELAELTAQAASDGVRQLVVGAVVRVDDKVLLLKRPADDFMGGVYELPSGKVEGDETLDAALIREVAEETGLTVTDTVAYLGSFDYTSGSGKKSRQFNFAVSVAKSEPVRLTEHDSYLWASLDEQLPVTGEIHQIVQAHRGLHPA
ncbi:NUDIX domain-containing protein [Saccharomonospora piscinae]|uniref:NUDIX hydrolase n=1 Tax=Saccharomonospora piscinae TaxID=687388 RepID=UPI00110709D4|nr:NUDIX domain-containing protein [Saccharomonospora piscinae]TLW93976.1 NUDIX domain-containing protein [Saccharomonospora piscinae]